LLFVFPIMTGAAPTSFNPKLSTRSFQKFPTLPHFRIGGGWEDFDGAIQLQNRRLALLEKKWSWMPRRATMWNTATTNVVTCRPARDSARGHIQLGRGPSTSSAHPISGGHLRMPRPMQRIATAPLVSQTSWIQLHQRDKIQERWITASRVSFSP